MTPRTKLPGGWTEDRVRRTIEHYESQSETEAVTEDEAALDESEGTAMTVPNDLVPAVRKLIERHRRSGPT